MSDDEEFVNPVVSDLFQLALARNPGLNERRFLRWKVEHENEIVDSVVSDAVEKIVGWYQQETGDGT